MHGNSNIKFYYPCCNRDIKLIIYYRFNVNFWRSQWSRGLRCRSAAACLLRLWVRIPPGLWMSVCCECCVLSGRGLCNELITCSEESYRLWCVVVCDLETSWMRRSWPTGGCCVKGKKNHIDPQQRPLYLMTYRDRKPQINLINRQERRLEFCPWHFGPYLN